MLHQLVQTAVLLNAAGNEHCMNLSDALLAEGFQGDGDRLLATVSFLNGHEIECLKELAGLC